MLLVVTADLLMEAFAVGVCFIVVGGAVGKLLMAAGAVLLTVRVVLLTVDVDSVSFDSVSAAGRALPEATSAAVGRTQQGSADACEKSSLPVRNSKIH